MALAGSILMMLAIGLHGADRAHTGMMPGDWGSEAKTSLNHGSSGAVYDGRGAFSETRIAVDSRPDRMSPSLEKTLFHLSINHGFRD